jgi:hypothetical protein
MKIINIHKVIPIYDLYMLLQEKMNPLFHKQKQNSDISFTIQMNGDAVEVLQPELYEGVLFRIEMNRNEIWITRSEHYVDDVNSLTLEAVLQTLFEELSGDKGVSLKIEG